MENYYFTFGQAHFTEDGQPMKDHYVKVTAENYNDARECFCSNFAAPIMGSPTKWAFQYAQSNFNSQYCPAGEYEHLMSDAATAQMALKNGDL